MGISNRDWADIIGAIIIGVFVLARLFFASRKQTKKINALDTLVHVSYALIGEKYQNGMAIKVIQDAPRYNPKNKSVEEKRLVARNKEIDKKMLDVLKEIELIVDS